MIDEMMRWLITELLIQQNFKSKFFVIFMPILKILFFEYLSKMFLFHFSRHYSGWNWSGRSQSEPNLLKSLLFALKKLAAYTIENNLHN